MRRLFAVLWLIGGCAETSEGTWLQSMAFEWRLANHRLSVLHVRPADGALDVALVGGASTTGVVFDPTGACIDQTCTEFPFLDTTSIFAVEGVARSARLVFAAGEATLRATADGVDGALVVELPRRARGDVVALIRGLRLDTRTDAALDTCYDPRHGWHPRQIEIALGVPTVDGRAVTVPVSAVFAAGASLEEVRACIDATYTLAAVDLTVDVLVVAGLDGVSREEVQTAGSFACEACPTASPPAQPPPEPVSVTAGGDAITGWDRLSWRFHTDDAPRGAYLRSMQLSLEEGAGEAFGHATNVSPITQLSGFEYAFHGGLVRAEGRLERETRTYGVDDLPATVDPVTGEAEVTRIAPE